VGWYYKCHLHSFDQLRLVIHVYRCHHGCGSTSCVLNSQPLFTSEGDRTMCSHLSRFLHYISSLNRRLNGAFNQLPRQLLFMLSTTIATKICRVLTRFVLMVRDCAPLPARGGGHFLIRLFSPTCFGLVQGFSSRSRH